jgi:hypothetical protein
MPGKPAGKPYEARHAKTDAGGSYRAKRRAKEKPCPPTGHKGGTAAPRKPRGSLKVNGAALAKSCQGRILRGSKEFVLCSHSWLKLMSGHHGKGTHRSSNGQVQIFERSSRSIHVLYRRPTGRVNMSLKGLDSLRILSDTKIIWLNVTGSGSENSRPHRKTHDIDVQLVSGVMPDAAGCTAPPRLHHAMTGADLYAVSRLGARNIFVLDDLVTTSCGTSVPSEMTLKRSRAETDLEPHYAALGPKVDAYWTRKNKASWL